MVKNAMTVDPIKPVSRINKSLTSIEYAPLVSISIKAPKIVGMLSKKANFEVSFMFKPTSKAPEIAMPDLEAPGKTANA